MNIKLNYIISAALAGTSALIILFSPIFLLPEFENIVMYLVLGAISSMAIAMILALYTAYEETNRLSSDAMVSDNDVREYSEMYEERRSK